MIRFVLNLRGYIVSYNHIKKKKSRYYPLVATTSYTTNSKNSYEREVGVDGFEPPTLCL